MEPHAVEAWLPIYTRIVGIVLGVALVTATILGYAGVEFAGAYVFVTGLIFYKSVHDYKRPDRGEADDHRDRWSGLE